MGGGGLGSNLEDSEGLAHSRLDVERLDVLPVLLEEGDQEVNTEHDVGKDLVLSHVAVSDGNTEAEDLLELELDGRLDLVDLVSEVLSVGDGSRELSGLGETGTEQSRDLLDEGLGGEEGLVLLRKLLDELLVLVELLQVVDGHVLDLDLLSSIDIGSISENADGHPGSGDVGELDGSRESLIPLRVVVLETNLELDGLNEVPLLSSLLVKRRGRQKGVDEASHA